MSALSKPTGISGKSIPRWCRKSVRASPSSASTSNATPPRNGSRSTRDVSSRPRPPARPARGIVPPQHRDLPTEGGGHQAIQADCLSPRLIDARIVSAARNATTSSSAPAGSRTSPYSARPPSASPRGGRETAPEALGQPPALRRDPAEPPVAILQRPTRRTPPQQDGRVARPRTTWCR